MYKTRKSPRKSPIVGSTWGDFNWVQVLKILPHGQAEVICNREHCGHIWQLLRCNLMSGRVKSCGCYHSDQASNRLRKQQTTHGHTSKSNNGGSPTFKSWSAMRNRCNNPSHHAYDRYGRRGIKVCDAWQNSFETFLTDMGERPPLLTLDRINVYKGYSKDNCKWATRSEQSKNQRPKILGERYWRHSSKDYCFSINLFRGFTLRPLSPTGVE